MASNVDPYFETGILAVLKPKKCSCQELLRSSKVTLSGWMRKKCLRNKLSFKFFNWPQMYLVICDGCLYYFKNEMSKRSSGSVSLYGYNRIIRWSGHQANDPPWAIKLEHVQPTIPSLYFATSSESEMIKWMRGIKKEMLAANHRAANPCDPYAPTSSDGRSEMSVSSWGSSDYNDVETSIYIEPCDAEVVDVRRKSMMQSYDIATVVDDSDELDDIEEFDEDSEAANSALAAVLQDGILRQKAAGKGVKHSESHGVQQHKNEEEEDYWSAVHFSGNKSEAAGIISDIGEDGVFLVRKGDDDSNVLVAYAGGCRKYKVFSLAGQSYLKSEGPRFDTLEELLYHYFSDTLPNTSVTLSTPYLLHPKYRANN